MYHFNFAVMCLLLDSLFMFSLFLVVGFALPALQAPPACSASSSEDGPFWWCPFWPPGFSSHVYPPFAVGALADHASSSILFFLSCFFAHLRLERLAIGLSPGRGFLRVYIPLVLFDFPCVHRVLLYLGFFGSRWDQCGELFLVLLSSHALVSRPPTRWTAYGNLLNSTWGFPPAGGLFTLVFPPVSEFIILLSAVSHVRRRCASVAPLLSFFPVCGVVVSLFAHCPNLFAMIIKYCPI